MRQKVLKKYGGILTSLLLLGLLASCRSSRPSEVSLLSRTYHNITARYNGYFNARELYEESIRNFESSYIDSYDQLLPVLKIPSETQGQDLAANMGSVVGKASLVIDRHEVSRWTDNAYLMIGKANFYRWNFHDALLSLQYVYNEYDDPDLQQESLAWIGLCNMLLGRRQDAETAFDLALSNIARSEKAAPFVYAAAAHFEMQDKQYERALPLLGQAFTLSRKKEESVRYAYIMGQLMEAAGQADSAIAAYQKVIELKPPYELVFHSKLNMARLYSVSAPGEAGMEDELWKMMEEEENKDYIDQLYYVLGNIAEQKQDLPLAIQYYTLSASHANLNRNQRGVAYLGIADMLYRAGDYDKARVYYDSTLNFLSPNYPDYASVQHRQGRLLALEENSRLIVREDSLQRLAALPPGERFGIVDAAVKAKLAEMAEQKRQQSQVRPGRTYRSSGGVGGSFGASGTWYFYNTAALSQGYSEFLRRWANRPNEDHWRRSNKQSLAGTEDPELVAGAEPMPEGDASSPEEIRMRFLEAIPLTPAKLDSSNFRIARAYYTIASIYEQDLNSPEKAIPYYEKLLERFPGSSYTAAVYYSLYKLYQGKDSQRSDKYKALVLSEFPDSDYALVITRPAALAAREEKDDAELNALYEETYRIYREGNYAEVIARCQSPAISRAGSPLAARFALLEALAVGHTDSLPDFTASLERVRTRFAQEEPGRRAGEWLTYLENHPEEFSGRSPVLLAGGSWLTDFDAVQRMSTEQARLELAALARAREEAERNSYYKRPVPGERFRVVIAVEDASLNLTSTRFGLGQLNRRFYASRNYEHALQALNGEVQLLYVGEFPGQEEARQYYERLLEYRSSVVRSPSQKTSIFYISAGNFDRLVDLQRLREYRHYFRVHFLNEAGAVIAGLAESAGQTTVARAPSAAAAPEEPAAAPEELALAPEEAGQPVEEQPREAAQVPDEPAPAASGLAAEESDETPEETAETLVESTEEDLPAADTEPEAEAPAGTPAPVQPLGDETEDMKFSPEAEEDQYMLVVAVNDPEMNLNSTRLGISQFNRGYFNQKNYRHNSKVINNETQLISVILFSNRAEALAYYREFVRRKDQIVKAPAGLTEVFAVSRDNFLLLRSQQDVIDYVKYFNKHYQRENE